MFGFRYCWDSGIGVTFTRAPDLDWISLMVEPAGSRVQGSGFAIQGLEFQMCGSEFWVYGLGLRVDG